MTFEEYDKIIGKRDVVTSEAELASVFDKLNGKSIESVWSKIPNAASYLIRSSLDTVYGYHYRPALRQYHGALIDDLSELVKSKTLSDAYKKILKLEFENNEEYKKYLLVLDQDKNINDMSEEEITCICRLIDASKDNYLKWSIDSYLYRLDGEGVREYVKNNLCNRGFVDHLLRSTGINPRSSYYSGCGVNPDNLNSNQIAAIFRKIFKLDQTYAREYVRLVLHLQTLGATEFIDNLNYFATNGFTIEGLGLSDNQVSLDGLYDEQRDMVSLISIYAMRGRDKNSQILQSNRMKEEFLRSIEDILEEYMPDFKYDDEYAKCCRREFRHDRYYYHPSISTNRRKEENID